MPAKSNKVASTVLARKERYAAEAIKKANKLMKGHGRLLVRMSGTEPKIRIMGESHNKNLILKCIRIIKSSIKK